MGGKMYNYQLTKMHDDAKWSKNSYIDFDLDLNKGTFKFHINGKLAGEKTGL